MWRALMTLPRRQLSTSVARRAGHGPEPPGSNLPFQIQNRYRFTLITCLFVGSGTAIPFILLRHQLLKK